jgi:hypothetical protein
MMRGRDALSGAGRLLAALFCIFKRLLEPRDSAA